MNLIAAAFVDELTSGILKTAKDYSPPGRSEIRRSIYRRLLDRFSIFKRPKPKRRRKRRRKKR